MKKETETGVKITVVTLLAIISLAYFLITTPLNWELFGRTFVIVVLGGILVGMVVFLVLGITNYNILCQFYNEHTAAEVNKNILKYFGLGYIILLAITWLFSLIGLTPNILNNFINQAFESLNRC